MLSLSQKVHLRDLVRTQQPERAMQNVSNQESFLPWRKKKVWIAQIGYPKFCTTGLFRCAKHMMKIFRELDLKFSSSFMHTLQAINYLDVTHLVTKQSTQHLWILVNVESKVLLNSTHAKIWFDLRSWQISEHAWYTWWLCQSWSLLWIRTDGNQVWIISCGFWSSRQLCGWKFGAFSRLLLLYNVCNDSWLPFQKINHVSF